MGNVKSHDVMDLIRFDEQPDGSLGVLPADAIRVGDVLMMPVAVFDGRIGHAIVCRVDVESVDRDRGVVVVRFPVDGETQWRAVPEHEARGWRRA